MQISMKSFFSLLVTGLLFLVSPAKAEKAFVLDLKGGIGPATSSYILEGLRDAKEQGAKLVIIRMDTPGGLDTAMRDIIQGILNAPFPIATFVAPQGARAASAGTYILYASHIAAMAPATNLGAATPVQIASPLPDAEPTPDQAPSPLAPPTKEKDTKPAPPPKPGLSDKAVNDAIAYIRGLAQKYGRNEEWAEKAVREAASLPAEEALELKVIDVMAENIPDLLEKIDGRTVQILDHKVTLHTKNLTLFKIEPDWRTKLLSVITNPNMVYFLLLLGFYGLIFEFTNPGAVIPGVVGAISILLALFALHILPISYAGLGLILLGITFMVSEAFIPSFGALGIGGLVAFVIGSVLLIDTDIPGYGIDWRLIATMSALSGLFFIGVIAMAVRARQRPVVSGKQQMLGSFGTILNWSNGTGHIRVHGEMWRATGQKTLKAGTKVVVQKIDGLTVHVTPTKGDDDDGV